MNSEKLTSSVTRTTFFFGMPLKGYKNKDDRTAEQKKIIGDTLVKISQEVLSKQVEAQKDKDVEVLYFGTGELFTYLLNQTLGADGMFAFGSFIFVFLYMSFHTQSFFIASMGMSHVFLSFPMAFFFQRIVFGIRFFDILNTFLIFIILGIGADDIFVFMDW